MGKIIKGIVFSGKARVTVIEITDIINEEIKLHNLTPLATAALGRALTVGAYISANMKIEGSSFSVTINGGGPLGSVVIAGEAGNFIRGFVANSNASLPIKDNGHLDVGGGVGKDGFITVIKDLGLKEPYVGRCALVSGEIAEDFTQYLYTSEGIRSSVALGVKVNKDGCLSGGGVIVEAMPDCDDNQLFILEDIMTNFVNVSDVLLEKNVTEIFDFYFGHLDSEILTDDEVTLRCNCSESKISNMIEGLGEKESRDIIEELGKIEVVCQFCNKKYIFTENEVNQIWKK